MNNTPHKILHLIETTGPGGAETVLLSIVSNLDAGQYDSLVVVTGHGWLYENLIRSGIATLIVESAGANDLRFLRKLCSTIRQNKVELIHSHLGGMNFYACLAGLLSGRPVIATYHGLVGDWDVKSLKNRLKHALIARSARQIVTVSDFLKRELQQVWGFHEKKMRTIYNGVDFEAFDRNMTGSSLREEFGISADTPLVGMVGNIRQTKGYDIYLRAASQVLEKIPEGRFLIVGQGRGELLDDLKELARRLNLTDKVIFTGFRGDVPAVLAQLDLFVLASTSEGLSIATIEAMGMQKPVVVTRSGGPEEIVENEVSGLLVPVGDPRALAESIISILGNPEKAQLLAYNAAKSVREKFSIEKNIAAYSQLYKSCLRS